jgi:hypothetical protein
LEKGNIETQKIVQATEWMARLGIQPEAAADMAGLSPEYANTLGGVYDQLVIDRDQRYTAAENKAFRLNALNQIEDKLAKTKTSDPAWLTLTRDKTDLESFVKSLDKSGGWGDVKQVQDAQTGQSKWIPYVQRLTPRNSNPIGTGAGGEGGVALNAMLRAMVPRGTNPGWGNPYGSTLSGGQVSPPPPGGTSLGNVVGYNPRASNGYYVPWAGNGYYTGPR